MFPPLFSLFPPLCVCTMKLCKQTLHEEEYEARCGHHTDQRKRNMKWRKRRVRSMMRQSLLLSSTTHVSCMTSTAHYSSKVSLSLSLSLSMLSCSQLSIVLWLLVGDNIPEPLSLSWCCHDSCSQISIYHLVTCWRQHFQLFIHLWLFLASNNYDASWL